MATTLLALKFFRQGSDLVAAGFVVFAIGEGVMLSGTAAGLYGSVPAFAAGTALWATALLLIHIPKEFALWTRLLGIVACLLFAVTSGRILWGADLMPISSPLPFFAYPFLVATFIGWIWRLFRKSSDRTSKVILPCAMSFRTHPGRHSTFRPVESAMRFLK